MLKAVIATYKCLISSWDILSGMRLEEAFSPQAMKSVKEEYVWLQSLDKGIVNWNENESDPISDIKAAKEAIQEEVGYYV